MTVDIREKDPPQLGRQQCKTGLQGKIEKEEVKRYEVKIERDGR
jgi:hypothetical protein